MNTNTTYTSQTPDTAVTGPVTGDIVYQNKDVASKVTGEALRGHSLTPFGLPHIRIVDVLPTNLPAIESNCNSLDRSARSPR